MSKTTELTAAVDRVVAAVDALRQQTQNTTPDAEVDTQIARLDTAANPPQ